MVEEDRTEQASNHRPLKIAIVGCGGIGHRLWEDLALDTTGDIGIISLWNRSELAPNELEAKSLSIDQRAILAGNNTPQFEVRCSNNDGGLEAALKGADIIINTAGVPRRSPTQNRIDLAKDNQPVVEGFAHALKAAFPEGTPKPTIIQATNPVDLMVRSLLEQLKGSDFPQDHVLGLSGEMDRARLIQSIAHTLKIPHNAIRAATVVGTHDENMVPVFSRIEVQQGGQWKPIGEVAAREQLESMKQDTAKGGARFVALRGKSDDGGPAAAVESMVYNMIAARKGEAVEPFNASVYSSEHGCCIGRPVRMRPDGGCDTVPLVLESGEQALFAKAVEKATGAEREFLGNAAGKSVPSASPG